MQVILSLESAEDLKKIYNYFCFEVFDVELGNDIISQIEVFLFTLLRDNPEIGRVRSDITYDFSVRSFIISSYIFYYYIENDDVNIIRILHQKQDINNAL